MAYTKPQLIDAYCRAKFFEPTAEKTKEQFMAEELAKQEKVVQYNIDQFGSAGRRLKNIAVRQLQDELQNETRAIEL